MRRPCSSASAFIAALAIGTVWIPAAAADYGPARDVHDARAALQRESSAHCKKLLRVWTMQGCLSDQSSIHDVTAIGDYAIVSRSEPPGVYQTLLVRRKREWRYHASSGGDGFVPAELHAYGVPREIAARLIAHDRNARNAAQPLRPEVHCIHTEASTVDTYFPNERASGAMVRFFGRIYDPYQGTLPPALIQRGYSPLMQIRRGDRVQVCLVYVPVIERTSRCRPAHDTRGRWYRVFDYRLRRAFTAPNANHGCGGA
ncbi:MAG: hypothetical protein QOF71_3224 [Candidatus Eremiobacteraeota bacterium]|jgi:hypothetical protein|nr:hypothetical protein [Candidatus Eremiobacteraeota bacterium]